MRHYATEILRKIFPLESDYDVDPDNIENITYKGDHAHGYEYENRMVFDEIQKSYDLIQDISQAITAYVGAVG